MCMLYHIVFTSVGGSVVHPPAETLSGLVLPSLAVGRKVVTLLEASSGFDCSSLFLSQGDSLL